MGGFGTMKEFIQKYEDQIHGVCPYCGGRRMAETAVHLVDRVFPIVPVRQWVFALYLVNYGVNLRSESKPNLFLKIEADADLYFRASACGNSTSSSVRLWCCSPFLFISPIDS